MTDTITLPRKDVESLRTALLAYIESLRKSDCPSAQFVFGEWLEFSNHITSALYDHD